MRQFDLHRNPVVNQRRYAPYFVILSSHHLEFMGDVIVAPLITDWQRPLRGIDLPISWDEDRLLLTLTDMFSVRLAGLGPSVGSLDSFEYDIRRALDRLFTGF